MIELLQVDITTLDVDAIVNAANSTLGGGGGVDGAIHRVAGPGLADAAMKLAPCPAGHAVITPGFRLPARYVIHAVGPVWRGGGGGEADVLRTAYDRIFEIARSHDDIRSIALPAISTGVYAFPRAPAAEIAVAAMRANEKHFDRIVACVFDPENRSEYERLLVPPAGFRT